MKQAYFASIDVGAHLDSASKKQTEKSHLRTGEPRSDQPLRPCAASPGLSQVELETIASHLRSVPVIPELPDQDYPVSLAFEDLNGSGRILRHSGVANFGDGLPVHSFSHVILDIPQALDAQQAILTWGSAQWQRSVADGLGQLTEPLFPPVSTSLDDERFLNFLQNPRHAELFRFVLSAFLTTPKSTRIVVAAAPDAMAHCIFGITRVLPSSVVEALTFSTYESDPLSSTARIIGTIPATESEELPATFFDGEGVAFNTFTQTQTSLNLKLAFVDFAIAQLDHGSLKELDEFRATWQRLGQRDVTMIDVVFRLQQSSDLTQDEAARALDDPALAPWACQRPELLEKILRWALSDYPYALRVFPRVAMCLKQRPQELAKFAEEIRRDGIQALLGGDLYRTRTALEVLLPMVSPQRGQAVWQELLDELKDPSQVTWELHAYLLPKWTRLRPLTSGEEPAADLQKWLSASADHFGEMFQLSISPAYQLAATLQTLQKNRDNIKSVAAVVAANVPMTMTILGQLSDGSQGELLAAEFFSEILQQAPQSPWLEEILRADPPYSAGFLNSSIEVALEQEILSPESFVKVHGDELLKRLAGFSGLNRFAERLLGSSGSPSMFDESVMAFLKSVLSTEDLSGSLKERAQAWLTVGRFLETPEVTRSQLSLVREAILLQPPLFSSTLQNQVLMAALDRGLHSNATLRSPVERSEDTPGTTGEMGDFQRKLVDVLLEWESLFDGTSHLYRRCLEHFRARKGFWKTPDQLLGFLAVALDATPSEALNSQTEGLETEAYQIVEDAVRRGGKKVWHQLNQATAEWPRPAKRQWQFLSQAILPEKKRGLGRDLLLASAGAFGTIMVFILLRWNGIL